MMDGANGFSDEFQLAALCDERLARHAVSAQPAWLWSVDGQRIHWANAAGAEVFAARNSTELARIPRGPADRAGRQIARLGTQLVRGGPLRLERLSGFGAALGGLTTCACLRIAFHAIGGNAAQTNPQDGILVVGVDAPARILPLHERLARLIEGIDAPLAVFAADGRLIATTSGAGSVAAEAETLADFGENLAQITLGEGRETALVAVIPHHVELAKTQPSAATSTAIDPDSVIAEHRAEENFIVESMAAESFLEQADQRLDAMMVQASEPQAGDNALHHVPQSDPPPENTLAPPVTVAIMLNPPPAPGDLDHDPDRILGPARSDDRGLQMPLRFVWQTDANDHFTLAEGDFARLAGPRVISQMGRKWADVAQALGLDPAGAIAKAMATHETWTGLIASWPVDDNGTRLPTELSAIPVFDSIRNFAGFRGFGICRDDDALARLTALRAQPESESASSAIEPEITPDTSFAPVGDDVADEAVAAEPASTHAEEPVASEPPALVSTANVVPFRSGPDPRPPVLTPIENSAFNEIARQLSARLEGKAANDSPPPALNDDNQSDESDSSDGLSADSEPAQPAVDMPEAAQENEQNARETAEIAPQPVAPPAPPANTSVARGGGLEERTLLERLPYGILVYRLDRLLFANPAFLERTGFASLHALTEAGGLDALYVEPGVATTSSRSEGGTPLRVSATEADPSPADARLISMNWDDEAALALVLLPTMTSAPATEHGAAAPPPPTPAPAPPVEAAPAAPPLVELELEADTALETPVAKKPDTNAESELAQARREINRIATAKADLLARISHDIRAPLSAVTGFAEMMIEQRFGPLGNERYVEYMKDIRASGERVASIVGDMLDVSQIESGQVALAFTANNLNHVIEQCVAAMQPQANRERVIIRSSLAKSLPPVIADARSLRQIAMTLMASAIRMSRTGAQIIVSTALGDNGEVALRLRDAGHVMSESEIGAVMDPLGSRPHEDGNTTSLDLSVARALVSANRAVLKIRSAAQTGTLIEVIFSQSSAANSASS